MTDLIKLEGGGGMYSEKITLIQETHKVFIIILIFCLTEMKKNVALRVLRSHSSCITEENFISQIL